MAMSPFRFTDGNTLVGRPASSFMNLFALTVDGPDLPPREPISPVPQDPPSRPQEPPNPPRHQPPPTNPVSPTDPPVPATRPDVPQPMGQWLMDNSKKGLAKSIRRRILVHAG